MPEGIGYGDPDKRTPQNADPTLDNFFRELLASKDGGGPLGVLPQSPEMGRDPRQRDKGMGAALSRVAEVPQPSLTASPILREELPPPPPPSEVEGGHALNLDAFESTSGISDAAAARAELQLQGQMLLLVLVIRAYR